MLYKIESSSELGRYAVAADDINAGDVIIEELPFVVGPKQNTVAICLGCYCPVDSRSGGPRCTKCKWPLCRECMDPEDHKGECEIFANTNMKFQPVPDPKMGCPQLDCITPLRMLLKKESDPERWEKDVSIMEYHDEARRKETENWNADMVNIVNYLRGPCKLGRFSVDLIMQILGILEVNAFEGKTLLGHKIRCIYPKIALPAHNCIPNTTRSVYPSDGFKMRLRASIDIQKNQQIYVSYTYILSGTIARLSNIKSGKFFICRCERCSDPTELGTHFSSFKCKKCASGLISTTDPFDELAEWKCSNCNFNINGHNIQKLVDLIQSEVDKAQEIELGPKRIEMYEQLYKKYENIFHPSHFILTNLKQNLVEMYGRVAGYGPSELSIEHLERKNEYCRNILHLLNIFEPGLSRSRASILYELHTSLVLQIKSEYAAGLLTGKNLKTRLQEAVDIIKECVNILQFEDSMSQDGIQGIIAKRALCQLKQNISQMD